MYQAYLTRKGVRFMQFLAYRCSFMPVFRTHSTSLCGISRSGTVQEAVLDMPVRRSMHFSCILQIFHALHGVHFSVTDWQFELYHCFNLCP